VSTKKVWDEVLAHLRSLDPQVKLIPCEDESHDDKVTVFVPVESVCYFSTNFDQKRRGYTLMLVTDEGLPYFLHYELGAIEEALADNPRFLRSGKQYLINISKIRRSRTNRARDLLFAGSEDWVENAVSPKDYLDAFKALFLTNV